MPITAFPADLFAPERRHLFVFSHQDDEIMYTGLIQRVGPETDFLWVTNGDGLAPFENADPEEYAAIRIAETDAVLTTLGRPLSRRRNIEESEIRIYDHFVELTLNPANKTAVIDYFHVLGNKVYQEIKRLKPEVIWTSAFQNGHPEHDLVHILTALSLRQLAREDGYAPRFYHLPQYEYTILIPHRFHPMYKGAIHEIRLNDEELNLKVKAFSCYPSQVKLFNSFEKVINRLGFAARLVGKGFSAESFLRRETFSPVDLQTMDYTRSTHWFEWANYMMDKHKNIKVRFDRHLAVIADELAKRDFEG